MTSTQPINLSFVWIFGIITLSLIGCSPTLPSTKISSTKQAIPSKAELLTSIHQKIQQAWLKRDLLTYHCLYGKYQQVNFLYGALQKKRAHLKNSREEYSLNHHRLQIQITQRKLKNIQEDMTHCNSQLKVSVIKNPTQVEITQGNPLLRRQ